MNYKHTQIGYLMIVVTLAVLVLFTWAYITTAHEPPSVDSGNNLLTTATMVVILFVLASFGTLHVSIDETYLRIKFGYGIFKNKFLLHDIVSAKTVKNHRRYGWGIRGCFWPKMRIYTQPPKKQVKRSFFGGLSYTDDLRNGKYESNEIITDFESSLVYNVSGFDAVEIKLKNGKRYRIGTDEPKDLEQAIRNSIK